VDKWDCRVVTLAPEEQRLSISQKLREVRDREFGGQQYAMARAWNMHQSTLSRWLRGDRIPDATEYDFLAQRLGLEVAEVHRLCMTGRDMLALDVTS
jgi:hypothetical protein